MASENENFNERRRRRAELRKKREREQRKLRIRLLLALAVLLVCIAGIVVLVTRNSQPQPQQPTLPTLAPPEDPDPTAPPETELSRQEETAKVIHIAAAGDLNINNKVLWSGQVGNGYDYTKAFMDVAPVLSGADLAVLNFEGIVTGPPYGSETTSAPQQLLEALQRAGVDLLQVANSCPINNGLNGLVTTLDNIRRAGLEPVGAFSSPEEFEKSKGYTICDVNGIKVAFVAFTKGVGSRGMPMGSEDCVNLLYTDYATTYKEVDEKKIVKVLKNVEAEKPDITIALLHWGSEFNDTISPTQKTITRLMQKNGVDVILGTHPHLVQQIVFDEDSGQLIAYSLGDFFGDGQKGGTNYSIILDLEITKDLATGVTKVTSYDYTPIYILAEDECDGDRRVVRIREAMAAYETNFVDSVTESAYGNMQHALERIHKRIEGEAQQTKK